jgi:uncharacterized repeat protein (TIGR02543 family)
MFLVAVVSLFSLAGCNPFFKPLPQYESGYWRYAVETAKDGTKKAYLFGFTELGQEQSTLIVPEEIDGIKIRQFGYVESGRSMWSNYKVGDFQSEKLERLYVPFAANDGNWEFIDGYYKLPNCYAVEWYDEICNVKAEKYIVGYNILAERCKRGIINNLKILANITYLYNYENAPNDNYYWVDSYDNSTVKYIPPEPTREGYTFGGWYKEAECINAWDFEVDKTGSQIDVVIDSTIEDYNLEDITFLYAKWNEK